MKEISYHLKKDYISEDKELLQLINETTKEHQVILLVAPQGTGKSYYFQNLKEPGIVFSPTRALTNQYYSMSIRDRYGRLICEPNTYIQAIDQIKEKIDDVNILIIDEIHKAVQYSSFAYQQTDTILKAFDEFYKSGKPIILTTATPELLTCLKDYPIFEKIGATIKIENDKDFIKEVRLMSNYTEQKIKDLVIRSYNNDNKSMQIVLINNTKSVTKFSNFLVESGIEAIVFLTN